MYFSIKCNNFEVLKKITKINSQSSLVVFCEHITSEPAYYVTKTRARKVPLILVLKVAHEFWYYFFFNFI
jgi:hypothetical protein